MKRVFIVLAACAAVLSPGLAIGAPSDTSMSVSSVGAGVNGYDWLAGTWSCSNTMAPSLLGALQSSTFTAKKLKSGIIAIHAMSPNGDVSAYNTYVSKTKTWSAPFADGGGYYGSESTQQSGKTIQWIGTFYAPDGAATPIRDTYTMLSMTKTYDLSEAKVGGAWKATAKTTCTKS